MRPARAPRWNGSARAPSPASLLDHPEAYGASFASSRTIAGQQGLCYAVTPAASAASGFSTGTFCYGKEGLTLPPKPLTRP
ncbi:MAG TPA: hypothetical protein VFC31_11055 [Candidatus Limnocylindria bacterium]|nr:hypothetical protein [Candidatus Limnocylindria bacterium]